MKYFISIAALTLVATIASASHSSAFTTVVARAPYNVEFAGKTGKVESFDVTVRGMARGLTRGLTYHVTSFYETFTDAVTACTSLGWKMVAPKTPEEQAALETVIAQNKIPGNVWLAAFCQDNRWVWYPCFCFLSAYHNFPSFGGIITPVPACQSSSTTGLMMFGNTDDNFGQWFKWDGEAHDEKNYVICQN